MVVFDYKKVGKNKWLCVDFFVYDYEGDRFRAKCNISFRKNGAFNFTCKIVSPLLIILNRLGMVYGELDNDVMKINRPLNSGKVWEFSIEFGENWMGDKIQLMRVLIPAFNREDLDDFLKSKKLYGEFYEKK